MPEKQNTTGPPQRGAGRPNFISEEHGERQGQEPVNYKNLNTIDQCEGNMNNGTVGGNFDEDIQIGRG